LGTCAQALETFFWFFSLPPVGMGVGGVAFRYIMVEAVGWFAYRFQHGRKWWPLLAFLCLYGIVYSSACSNAVMGVSLACKHKGNISRLLS
jgi:biotin transporter BioY